MTTHVIGLFEDSEVAERAVKDLLASGFAHDKISLLVADPNGKLYKTYAEAPIESRGGEGVAVGITSGAIVGGLLGLLIGAGLFFVPVGLLAAGPLAGLLAGGAAGAATGGILGGLIGMGISEEDADVYAESIRRGGTLVSVESTIADVPRAHEILHGDGAVDIEDLTSRYREEGFIKYDPTAPTFQAKDVVRDRERILKESGALDEEMAYRERIFGSGPGTGPGSYADNPPPRDEPTTDPAGGKH